MPLHPPHRQNHNPQPFAARVLRFLSMAEDGMLIGLLAMMILLAAGQVILRDEALSDGELADGVVHAVHWGVVYAPPTPGA